MFLGSNARPASKAASSLPSVSRLSRRCEIPDILQTYRSPQSVIGIAFILLLLHYHKETPWPESANELYRPGDHRFSAKLVPTFADRGVSRGQRDGSLRPYSRFYRPEPLLFLSGSSSVVLTKLSGPHSRPLLPRKSCSARNRSKASGSVARNSDHETTETVYYHHHLIYNFNFCCYYILSLSSLCRCYKLLWFVLHMTLFFSLTRPHFIIGLWPVNT
jgi:hypothetical protein